MRHMPVHGTYPFDSGRWRNVRELSVEEAMTLAKTPPENMLEWPRNYPWINKGFIVLDLELPKVGDMDLAMLELLIPEAAVQPGGIPIGAQAVYLHDGKLSLIQYTAKVS
jgi:hypothetical protein